MIIDSNLSICKEIKYSLQDDATDAYYTQSIKEAVQMMKEKLYTGYFRCLSRSKWRYSVNKKMLFLLKEKGYVQTSLAVQKENYAVKMYKNSGFYIVNENSEEYIILQGQEEVKKTAEELADCFVITARKIKDNKNPE